MASKSSGGKAGGSLSGGSKASQSKSMGGNSGVKASVSKGGGGGGGGLGSLGKNFTSSAKDFMGSLKNTFGRGPSEGRTVTDPKTGKSYTEPSYKGASFKGLTSNDPANVARNREAAARYAAAVGSGGRGDEGRQGVFDIGKEKAAGPGAETAPVPPLADIGRPTNQPGPVEVPTPVYGLPGLLPQPGFIPQPSYGMAFQGLPTNVYNPNANINLMDIFGMYPNFGMTA